MGAGNGAKHSMGYGGWEMRLRCSIGSEAWEGGDAIIMMGSKLSL